MIEERQTVTGAYREIRAHEQLCAERYKGINEKLGWVLKGMVGLVLTLLTWSAAQLYAMEPLRLLAAQQRTSAVAPAAVPTPPAAAANP